MAWVTLVKNCVISRNIPLLKPGFLNFATFSASSADSQIFGRSKSVQNLNSVRKLSSSKSFEEYFGFELEDEERLLADFKKPKKEGEKLEEINSNSNNGENLKTTTTGERVNFEKNTDQNSGDTPRRPLIEFREEAIGNFSSLCEEFVAAQQTQKTPDYQQFLHNNDIFRSRLDKWVRNRHNRSAEIALRSGRRQERKGKETIDTFRERLAWFLRAKEERLFIHKNKRQKATTDDYLTTQLRDQIKNLKAKLEEYDRLSKIGHDMDPACDAALIIISSGSGHLDPCVLLKTNKSNYLFNCPEAMDRQLNNIFGKVSIGDIFVSSGYWNHLGGIMSFALKMNFDPNEISTNLFNCQIHGPDLAGKVSDVIRPYAAVDMPEPSSGKMGNGTNVVYVPFDKGSYEDSSLKVTYIPLLNRAASSKPINPFVPKDNVNLIHTLNLAYLIELKKRRPAVDASKCDAKGIPRGPLIGQMIKNGHVTLQDGTVVKLEEVLSEESLSEMQQPKFLVVNCPSASHFEALDDAISLRPFRADFKSAETSSSSRQPSESAEMKYILHFTPQSMLETETYKNWMRSFGSNTQHLIVNGSGNFVPHTFRRQNNRNVLMNGLHESIFPLHFSADDQGQNEPKTDQDNKQKDESLSMTYCRPFEEYILQHRSPRSFMDQYWLMDAMESNKPPKEKPNFEEILNRFKKESEVHESSFEWTEGDIYPRLTVRGTASSLPTMYRNVSGYTMEISPDFILQMDCGEGTVCQMIRLHGRERAYEILRKIRVVSISHAHQDHFLGIFDILTKRKQAFDAIGEKNPPNLVLIAPGQIFAAINVYKFHTIDNIAPWIGLQNHPAQDDPQYPKFFNESGFFDVTDKLEEKLATNKGEAFPFKQLALCRVHHPRAARALIFVTKDDRKIVFSGDTTPCNWLAEAGVDADLLIHEASFQDGRETMAAAKRHSTMAQAISIGQRMRAKHVLLTHFSSRYASVAPLPDYLDEQGNVSILYDDMVIRWADLNLLPKLNAVYRSVFYVQLQEMDRLFVRHRERESYNQAVLAKRKVFETEVLDELIPEKKKVAQNKS